MLLLVHLRQYGFMKWITRLAISALLSAAYKPDFAQPSSSMQFIFRFYSNSKLLGKKALLKKYTCGMYDGRSLFWPYPAPVDHDDSIRSPFYCDDSTHYSIITISSVYPPYYFSLKDEHDSIMTLMFPYVEKSFACDSLTFHPGIYRIDTNCIDRKNIPPAGAYIRDMKNVVEKYYPFRHFDWLFQHQQFIKDKYTWYSDLDEVWKVKN